MRAISDLQIRRINKGFPDNPPTVTEIQEFETVIEARLPAGYITMLRYCNGGWPWLNIVIPESTELKPFLVLEKFFFLNSDKTMSNGMWGAFLGMREHLPRKYIPIGIDQGGDFYFLNLIDDGSSVWFARNDESPARFKLVAKSFEEFLDNLLPYSDLPKIDPLFELGPNGIPQLKAEYLPNDEDGSNNE